MHEKTSFFRMSLTFMKKLASFPKWNSPTSGWCLTPHPSKAELCPSGSNPNFPTRVPDGQLTRSRHLEVHGKESYLGVHTDLDSLCKPDSSPCFAKIVSKSIFLTSHLIQGQGMTAFFSCSLKQFKPQSTIQSPQQHKAGSLFLTKCFLCV